MTQTSADAWRPSSMACSDRKSTRLNSSHSQISYAVFCLKKKKNTSELESQSNLVCRLLLEKKKEDNETVREEKAVIVCSALSHDLRCNKDYQVIHLHRCT